jgi:hypothetical protein
MLTPKQVVRMLHLCADILAIQYDLPPAPPFVDTESFAEALLPHVQNNLALLVELRELLQAVQ